MNSSKDSKKREPEKPSFTLWKVLWLGFVPFMMVYQFSWGFALQQESGEFWQSDSSRLTIALQLGNEVIIYGLMMWFIAYRTQSRYPVSKFLALLFLGGIICSTLYSLINWL